MNNNEYILNQEKKNRALLLAIYRRQMQRIQKKLAEAIEKGNSITHLKKIQINVQNEINKLEQYFKVYSKTQARESYLNGAKQADSQFRQLKFAATIQLSTLASFGELHTQAINVLAQATYKPLGKLAQSIGRQTTNFLKRENFKNSERLLKAVGLFIGNDTLQKIGINNVQDVVFGSGTWQQAAKKIKEEIMKEGAIKVPYYDSKGNISRFVDASDYAKMVARTTTARTMREGTKDRIKEVWGDKGDLVEITGKSKYDDSPCVPYEGKILSLNGDTDEKIIAKLGSDYAGLLDDAIAEGLFHPNCVHSFGVSDTIAEAYND